MVRLGDRQLLPTMLGAVHINVNLDSNVSLAPVFLSFRGGEHSSGGLITESALGLPGGSS